MLIRSGSGKSMKGCDMAKYEKVALDVHIACKTGAKLRKTRTEEARIHTSTPEVCSGSMLTRDFAEEMRC